MGTKRAKGITPIALILGWLSIGGFANFYMMQKHHEYGTPLLSVFALLYGILALSTSVGLWKMKKWSYLLFVLWGINALLGILVFQFTFQKNAPLLAPVIFFVIFSGLLFLLSNHIKKALNETP